MRTIKPIIEPNYEAGVAAIDAQIDRMLNHPEDYKSRLLYLTEELLRMGCCCGVTTADDYRSWDAVQKELPALLAQLKRE